MHFGGFGARALRYRGRRRRRARRGSRADRGADVALRARARHVERRCVRGRLHGGRRVSLRRERDEGARRAAADGREPRAEPQRELAADVSHDRRFVYRVRRREHRASSHVLDDRLRRGRAGRSSAGRRRGPRHRRAGSRQRPVADQVAQRRAAGLSCMRDKLTAARAPLAGAVALLLGSGAAAQEAPLSFTDEQADAGRRVYEQHCVQCHGANLDDGALGAPLKGIAFMAKYGGEAVETLFDVTRTTMPTGNPGSLDAETYASLVAYMLRENDVVAGDTALPVDSRALAAMRIPRGGFSFMDFSPYTARAVVERPTPLARFTPVDDAAIADPPAGDWLGWRRGYSAHGFSPLAEITTRNVGELRLAWSWTLPAGSTEGVPVVRDGTMFVVGYGDIVQALDAATGDLLWQYTHTLASGASPFHKRGIALYGE